MGSEIMQLIKTAWMYMQVKHRRPLSQSVSKNAKLLQYKIEQ